MNTTQLVDAFFRITGIAWALVATWWLAAAFVFAGGSLVTHHWYGQDILFALQHALIPAMVALGLLHRCDPNEDRR